MSNPVFYASLWALQLLGIIAYYLGSRMLRRQLRRLADDLREAQALLSRAADLLRDINTFDARYLRSEMMNHVERKRAGYLRDVRKLSGGNGKHA